MERELIIHSPECFASYMGLWMYEQSRLLAMHAAICAGQIAARAPADAADEGPGFVNERGIAVIPISGTMMKGRSKYGGTSTVETRRAIRTAANDPAVKGIMLHIDSPGGTVAGTFDLAEDFRRAQKVKDTAAHADDLMASAALWVGSQAMRLTAGKATEVGSIGSVAVVEDTSKAAEMQGVKVHIVSTGPYKGAFTDGAPVTAEQLAYLQDRVDSSADMFIAGLAAGRNMDGDAVRKLATGQVWSAKEAKSKGLIDSVESFDQAFLAFEASIQEKYKKTRKRVETASALLDLETLSGS